MDRPMNTSTRSRMMGNHYTSRQRPSPVISADSHKNPTSLGSYVRRVKQTCLCTLEFMKASHRGTGSS